MNRLDHQDAYLLAFTAHVTGAVPDDPRAVDGGSAHAWVRLDASAFYPTSGGQPHDVGTLDDAVVDDVRIADDGAVEHRVPGPTGAWPAGRTVQGRVDGDRRARHRQRHSAQHLLSQAFVRTDPAFATRSVALTSADLTVDLAGEPDDEAIAAAERLANEAAYANWAVATFEVDEADLERFPLRRPPKVQGRVRLVAMGPDVAIDPAGAWEISACGGTHVRSTAEVAPIVVVGRERIRGGLTRVTFRAGWEAWAHHREAHAAATAAAVALTTSVADLPAKVVQLAGEAAALRRALTEARGRIAADLADALVGDAPAPGTLVVAELDAADADVFAPLADALAERGATAVLAVVQGAKVEVIATSGAGVDVRPALKAALDVVGGRGGGKPARAQGAGADVEHLAEALAAAHHVLHDD
jgi:alanyl-tRNA synthetase